MLEVEAFRTEVREWLADNQVGENAALKGLGGPGREHEAFEERLAWNRHLAKAGLTCLGWPEEHGGRGLTVAHRVAFYEEYAKADAPDKVNHLGEELLGPTLIAYGTPEQQQRFLPKILDVTELWSQGYSEPGAGSDLANVSTSAELRDDVGASGATGKKHWIINGQKVWTSLAHWAQWCFVVARSEKGSKRHAGLAYLLVPLDQPGVQIRPIIQLTGDSEFNEVFFDDARTDADLVVGEPGDGWRVAMGTLTFERGVSTLGQQIRYKREHAGIVEMAKRTGAIDDPVIRERLTRSWAGLQTMRSYALKTMDVEGGGQAAPGKDSVSKLLWANWHRELGEIAMDVQGMAGLTLDDGEFDEWQRLFLFSRSDTIYGGSNEIQRNIIAERVLGLPREAKGG
jgi:alkylation response protein AidB-like acyl-CoA dehydrogenase